MKDVHVVVSQWCDYCLAEDEDNRTPAETIVEVMVVLPGQPRSKAKLRELMACDPHYKQVDDLLHVLENCPIAEGVRKSPIARSHHGGEFEGKRIECELCGVPFGASYLPRHVWTNHIGQEPPDKPSVCPDCGWTPANTLNEIYKRSGVGNHRVAAHDYSPIGEALAEYRARNAPPKPRKAPAKKAPAKAVANG